MKSSNKFSFIIQILHFFSLITLLDNKKNKIQTLIIIKKNSPQVTRSDLFDLLSKINASLDKRDKRFEERFASADKRFEERFTASDKRFNSLEAGQKEIIRRLDRMKKRNGHARSQLKKAGKNLIDV